MTTTLVEAFGPAYASAYDAFYADKDYEAECDLIANVFRRFAERPPLSILDLGCGTGGHSVILAARGYEVTGVDRSAVMLDGARAKSRRRGVTVAWREGDLRTIDAGRQFDAVLLMFAVLSYQIENRDVLAALVNTRHHLVDGGLLVFDAWYGPGVLTDPPKRTTKVAAMDGLPVSRTAAPQLDARRHLCRVDYRLADAIDAEECHVVRYFFPKELELFLELSGFRLLSLSPFPDLDGEPTERTWNVLAVARAS